MKNTTSKQIYKVEDIFYLYGINKNGGVSFYPFVLNKDRTKIKRLDTQSIFDLPQNNLKDGEIKTNKQGCLGAFIKETELIKCIGCDSPHKVFNSFTGVLSYQKVSYYLYVNGPETLFLESGCGCNNVQIYPLIIDESKRGFANVKMINKQAINAQKEYYKLFKNEINIENKSENSRDF